MKKEIHSESYFVLHLFKFILLFPVIVILFLFNKKIRVIYKKETTILKNFFLEAKYTNILIITNLIFFIIEVFYLIPSGHVENFVLYFQQNLSPINSLIAIFESWFLHAGLSHLFGNMIALFVFGRIIEKEYKEKIFIIYFGAGLISSTIAILFGQYGIGASGAIAGLISLAILKKPLYITYQLIIPLPIIVLGWFLILSDINGILIADPKSNIGHIAHLGGYLAISIISYIFDKKERKLLQKGFIINLIFVTLMITIKSIFKF